MANYTEHYDLIKPEDTDYYTINDFNENMDTIDSTMASMESAVENINTTADTLFSKTSQIAENVNTINQKIGTSSSNKTLFSLLETSPKNGLTAIKSIQHIVHTLPSGEYSSTCALTTAVTPANCIVLLERLYDDSHTTPKLQYTLNPASISMSHSYFDASSAPIFGFWIIEFM